jgi:hypothetical protein
MLTNLQLRSKVDALWDRFWQDAIANPMTTIEQRSYIILLNCLEDTENTRVVSIA